MIHSMGTGHASGRIRACLPGALVRPDTGNGYSDSLHLAQQPRHNATPLMLALETMEKTWWAD